jgi:hypothetical protein
MKMPRLLPVVASLFLTFAPAAALHAQLTKIFVASFGNDANDGSRGAPKRNFQPAHDAVAAGGQIVVLDTAGYGQLTITKGLAITVPPGVNGFVTVSGTSTGITVNAGSSASVSLRGLIIEGGGSGVGIGVLANDIRSLTIEDCTVRNFGEGIFLVPTASSPKLFVYHTTVRNCGYGLDVEVTGAAFTTMAVVNACVLQENTVAGLFVQINGGGGADVSAADCEITANATGIQTANPGVQVRLNNCNITGNTTGYINASGTIIASRGNNTFEKNGGTGTFPESYTAK